MDIKFVAILTSSPALASIIAMVLDCEENLSVQVFTRLHNLKQHMRIAPVDMIVCDYEIEQQTAARVAIDLRLASEWQDFKIIALAETLSPRIRQSCKFASIDEVIVKPMSPLLVRDRVLSRLHMAKKNMAPLATNKVFPSQNAGFAADNIVELFVEKPASARDQIQP